MFVSLSDLAEVECCRRRGWSWARRGRWTPASRRWGDTSTKCQQADTETKWDMTLQQCTILLTATASVPSSKILFSDGGVVRLLQRGNSSVHKINNFASLQHLLFSLGATASTRLWSQTNHFVLLHYDAIQTVLHMFVVFFPFPLPPQVSSRLSCIEQSTNLREVFTIAWSSP